MNFNILTDTDSKCSITISLAHYTDSTIERFHPVDLLTLIFRLEHERPSIWSCHTKHISTFLR